jgi:hypothetical protein
MSYCIFKIETYFIFSVAPVTGAALHNVQHNGCPSLVSHGQDNPAILEGKPHPSIGKIFSGPEGPSSDLISGAN